MNKIIAGGFEILISGVFAYPLDEKLLGARVDERFMAALDRIAAKYKITLTGEGGEFETFTADAPFYKKRIVVDKAAASCRNNNGLYTILEAHLEDKPPIAPKADADAEDDADYADNADGKSADSADNTGDTHTVLICNLCSPKYPLSVAEYVKPVENIVKAAGFGFKTLHYSEVDAALTRGDLPDISAIILCGTALKDNGFADSMGDAGNADKFRFIRDASGKDIPILGIGTGFQVLAKIAGGDVIGERDLRIGMTKAKVVKTTGTAEKIFENRDNFEVYELHKNAVTLPDCFEALAVADVDGGNGETDGNGRILAAKHRDKEIYGVLFHPEVRNEYVVENFLKRC